MQTFGLEWLYRFMQEPVRLWKRYLLINPLYLVLVALQFFKVLPRQKKHNRIDYQASRII
jgi:UDP-N-acetyl-D-mannosaminuronic acid transferase (WecB/TagA/CpsF family)